jgi:hypothetical protein
MSAQHQTENLTIHHKVKDYAAWRKGYDDHEKRLIPLTQVPLYVVCEAGRA